MGPAPNDRDEFSVWLNAKYPDLGETAAKRLHEFGELVEASADRLGLIAAGDRPQVYMRHFREALAPPLLQAIPAGARVLDVGSGGGFPAIPLAIVREDLHVTLTERRERKASFLQRVVLTLNLTQVFVFPGTLEDLARQTDGPSWECALSRAVRWTPRMVRVLEGMLPDAGTVIRYGAPAGIAAGVAIHPLEDSDHAIQVWPRSHWEDLPAAL
jgi:16S rRNA (guanine(527)-N(7))-methyltransferase RsmG